MISSRHPPLETMIRQTGTSAAEREVIQFIIWEAIPYGYGRKGKDMSKYTDLAMERRGHFTPDGRPAWNCCQAVVSVFAQDAGYDENACMKAATYFRGGMQMGSVCGAVTGSLMAIGLAGVDDPDIPGELFRKIRENHDGLVNCKDLLRVNAENGGEKMPHCNAMIRECIGYVEEILREKGKLA